MTDLRTRRTLAAIDRSMYRLLQKHPFTALNVSMICREAGITRSTYYQYYLDKNDWLDRVVGRYLLVAERQSEDDVTDLSAMVAALRPDADKVTTLLAIHDAAGDLAAQLRGLFSQRFAQRVTGSDRDYLAGLYADAALRTLAWQLQHQEAETAALSAIVKTLLEQDKTR